MINPKSLANLTPFGTIDRERHREISRAGGLSSGATRRRKSRIQRIAGAYMALSPQELHELQELYRIPDITPYLRYIKEITTMHNIVTDESSPLDMREQAVVYIMIMTGRRHLLKYVKRD